MSTTWNNELELKLIDCFQSEPILWQSKENYPIMNECGLCVKYITCFCTVNKVLQYYLRHLLDHRLHHPLILTIKCKEVVHKIRRTLNQLHTSYQRAGTSHSSNSEPPIYYSPPPQIHIHDQTSTPAAPQVIITSKALIQPATQESTNYICSKCD